MSFDFSFLGRDAATSGLALLTEEMQARFLGNTDPAEWVVGDAISEAPPISLTDFLQHVAAADAYKFNILGYNCHHYLSALTARMAAAMARTSQAGRMVYRRSDQKKKEYELQEAEEGDVQRGLLEKLVDSRGFSLLHGRMMPEAGLVGGGMAKLTFDEEGKLIFDTAGESVHATEDQTFLASDMDAFFDPEEKDSGGKAGPGGKTGQEGNPACSYCGKATRAGSGERFHCNGCGPEGKTHWFHKECLEECMDFDHVQVDGVRLLPGGRTRRSAVSPGFWGGISTCCTSSIAGLRKFRKEMVNGSSSAPTDIKYQQDLHA